MSNFQSMDKETEREISELFWATIRKYADFCERMNKPIFRAGWDDEIAGKTIKIRRPIRYKSVKG